jgi:hypothetical protein
MRDVGKEDFGSGRYDDLGNVAVQTVTSSTAPRWRS